MTSKATPLAVIGIGCMFPKAPDRDAYWANVRDGVDAIVDVPPTHWDPAEHFDPDPSAADRTYGRRGGFLDPVDFEPLAFGVAPRDLEATDTSQLLALHAAREALRDAGYGDGGRDFDRERAGVVLGVTGALELVIPLGARLGHPLWRRALRECGVDDEQAQRVVERISGEYVPWQENSFPGLLGNVVAGRIANRLDLRGTNCVVDAACASSLSALHLAALELETGRADLVLTGGVDTFNDVFMYTCFSKTPALSPTQDARPFASDADGTVLGEGVGVIALKRLADAEAAGDRIYAVVRGIGSSSDGKGQAIYAPSAEGQARALRAAYAAAGVDPSTIGLIEAHGTGTKVGDATEAAGLREVFGDATGDTPRSCALGSVKSMIGHTKAAAGVAGVIKAAMALRAGVLPPTLKVGRANDAVAPPLAINTIRRPWIHRGATPRRAGVSAFGFGGSNFHCVLEAPARAPSVDWAGQPLLVAVSADDRAGLAAAVRELGQAEDWTAARRVAADQRNRFASTAPWRLAAAIDRDAPLDAWARGAEGTLAGVAEQPATLTPGGLAIGSGPASGRAAAMFPGQGAQYVGMLRDLACGFAAVRDTIADVDAEVPGLAPTLFPGDLAPEHNADAALRATAMAQPAIGAVSLGAWRALAALGVRFDAAVGHSYGELTALCAAGSLPAHALAAVSRRRGELMTIGDGDRGTMLAVAAPAAAVSESIADLDVVLANHNAPRQVVLSGSTQGIETAATRLAAAGHRVRQLDVAAAFHSRFVAAAQAPFADALAAVPFAAPTMPVYANVTGSPYPDDPARIRGLLAEQLASPVEFVRCVERMFADGVRTFVEIGPRRRLCGLVSEILDGQGAHVVAVDASSGRRSGMADLARVIATLAALGHEVDVRRWDEDAARIPPPPAKAPLRVPVIGANPRPRPAAASPAPSRPAPAPPEPDASHEHRSPPAMTTPSTDNVAALIRLQEQTAELHRQFLTSQLEATRMLVSVVSSPPANGTRPDIPAMAPALGAGAQAVSEPSAAPVGVAPSMPTRSETVAATAAASPPRDVVPRPAGVHATRTSTGPQSDAVEHALLEVVADKTGYPASMLELSMGLDSDLGIDSIKRVEILAGLGERLPSLPAIGPEHVGQLRTLGDILVHLRGADASPRTVAGPGAAAESSGVTAVLLEVVADKTGYPASMLELSMGLDSDLGIDSIKRVEILAGLSERLPSLPAIGPEHVGQLRTLGDIVEHLGGARGPAQPAVAPTTDAGPAERIAGAAGTSTERVAQTLLEVVAEHTGYPANMLELSMGLDSDLGIDSIKRVEILAGLSERLSSLPALGPEHVGALQTLGDIVQHLTGDAAEPSAAPAAEPTSLAAEPASHRAEPPQREAAARAPTGRTETVPTEPLVQRAVAWQPLPAPDAVQALPRTVAVASEPGDALAEALATALRETGCDARLVDVNAPVGGSVAGLVIVASAAASAHAGAALARARDVAGRVELFATVTALDGRFGVDGLDASVRAEHGALAGLAKTAGHEWTEARCRAFDVDPRLAFDTAAASVVSWLQAGPGEPVEVGVTRDGAGTLVLEHAEATAPADAVSALGPDDVVLMSGGARGVTAALAEAVAQTGASLVLLGRSPEPAPESPATADATDEAALKRAIVAQASATLSPRDVRQRYAQIVAAREIRATLQRLSRAAGRVAYRSADVRDPQAVADVVAWATAELGPVTALVHGAGVLADKRIADKRDADFDAVYGTKVGGLRNLLDALADAPLRSIVLFSSSTGRLGRAGQADYAMANEALNKLAQVERRRRPDARVLSIAWGPWAGGMVTPALRERFAAEGVETIGLEAGAAFVLDALRDAGPTEVVVLGPRSRLPGRGLAELPTVFTRHVDVASHPVLAAHALGGNAVLPTVLMLEWFAHAALHDNPGLKFVGVDDLRILRGVRLGPDAGLDIRLCAGPAVRSGDGFAVAVQLCSGGNNGHRVVHARATALLANALPPAPVVDVPSVAPHSEGVDDLYRDVLFHGEALHAFTGAVGVDARTVVATAAAAPIPAAWMDDPPRARWITDPLALDAGLQALIVWSHAERGVLNLPARLGRLRLHGAFPRAGTTVVGRIRECGPHQARADIDWVDERGRLVARLEDCTCTLDAGLRVAFARGLSPARSEAVR